MNILCLCGSRLDVSNLLPIIENLRLKEGIHFDFFDTDPIFHQEIKTLLKNYSIMYSNIKFKKPFYMSNIFEKLKGIFLVQKIDLTKKYSFVICGQYGFFEYLLSKRIKSESNGVIYVVQDSILLYPENEKFIKKIRVLFYKSFDRYSLCKRIFVSGEATKETLIRDGVNAEKIIITGIP